MSQVMTSNDHFSTAPQVEVSRSRFSRPSKVTTTFNAGQLIPFYVDEVLPGDTFDLSTQNLTRMATPLYPVMDDAFLDIYYFFVPNRLVWSHWKEFMGENTTGPWTQKTEYNVPCIIYDSSTAVSDERPVTGTLWDYFGLPAYGSLGLDGGRYWINALPFRAYVLIWNEFFRDQNINNPAYFYNGDSNLTFQLRMNHGSGETEKDPLKYYSLCSYDDILNSAIYGGFPLPVNKLHDYFTSCLPQPQKGDPINIFNSVTRETSDGRYGFAPVVTTSPFSNDELNLTNPMRMVVTDGSVPSAGVMKTFNGQVCNDPQSPTSSASYVLPNNLGVDLSQFNLTISELRTAFQLQRLLEAEARGGTRYRELLYSMFGVVSPDSTQQVPEYLCGSRQRIGIDQVVQTSSTTDITPQGNVSAYSLTLSGTGFTKSFTEHGYVIGVCCVRTNNTYQQTINKMFARRTKYDFYFPQLANISEQPVYNAEIFASVYNADPSLKDKDPFYISGVFGYQEAWAEYRYKPNLVTGYMNSNANGSLDAWTYAQDYSSFESASVSPSLSSEWLAQGSGEIDRTLAVSSTISHQFISDFSIDLKCTRCMPLYSVPGLADHH